jgi:hypothetical protein
MNEIAQVRLDHYNNKRKIKIISIHDILSKIQDKSTNLLFHHDFRWTANV